MQLLYTRDFLVMILLMVSLFAGVSSVVPEAGTQYSPHMEPSIISDLSPMNITSDYDFAVKGWTGSGTKNDPYLLDNALFTDANIDGTVISIRDTTAYFVIQHSIFRATDATYTLRMHNISHGIIRDCTFENVSISIRSSSYVELTRLGMFGAGISVIGSKYVLIYKVRVIDSFNNGIYLSNVMSSSISFSDIISSGNYGIVVINAEKMIIRNNLLSNNTLYELYLMELCNYNFVVYNIFNTPSKSRYQELVVDDGITNFWDDGVSQGNWYSNYNGDTSYRISGTAASVDHFPAGPGFPFNVNNSIAEIVNDTQRPTTFVPVDEFVPMDSVQKIIVSVIYVAALGGIVVVFMVVSGAKKGLLQYVFRKNDDTQ